jgi:hypothetical protein
MRLRWEGNDMNIKTMIARGVAPLVATLLLTACAAPKFEQPAVATPAAFKEAQIQRAPDGSTWKVAQPAEAQPRGEWWRVFRDPALDALVAEAAANNQNLSVAAARVKQARAIAGIAEADRVPQIGVDIGAQRARLSPLEALQAPGTAVAPATSYSARLSASYEVDLFGRVASGVAAARGDAAAVEASFRSVLLSLQADVAQTYFRLRALDAELDTVNRTVALREEGVRVTGRRFELGDIGEFDLARAKTELSTARAEAIGLQRQRRRPSMRWPSCSASRHPLSAPHRRRWMPPPARGYRRFRPACRPRCWNAAPTSPAPSVRWKRPTHASAWPARPCSRRWTSMPRRAAWPAPSATCSSGAAAPGCWARRSACR